jgi:hypothetical protein
VRAVSLAANSKDGELPLVGYPRLFIQQTTVTDPNNDNEAIKSRLISGDTCYYTVQNLRYSCLLSKKVKIKLLKQILTFVLYGCKTLSLALKEEFKLRFQDSELRLFGNKRASIRRK